MNGAYFGVRQISAPQGDSPHSIRVHLPFVKVQPEECSPRCQHTCHSRNTHGKGCLIRRISSLQWHLVAQNCVVFWCIETTLFDVLPDWWIRLNNRTSTNYSLSLGKCPNMLASLQSLQSWVVWRHFRHRLWRWPPYNQNVRWGRCSQNMAGMRFWVPCCCALTMTPTLLKHVLTVSDLPWSQVNASWTLSVTSNPISNHLR